MKTGKGIFGSRQAVSAILAAFAFLACFWLLKKNLPYGDVILRLEVIAHTDATLRLQMNGRREAWSVAAAHDNVRTLSVVLPRQPLRKLTLEWENGPEALAIRRIRLQSFSRRRQWDQAPMPGFYRGSAGDRGHFQFNRRLLKAVTDLQRETLWPLLLALVAGLVGWRLSSSFGLDTLRRLRSTRQLTPLTAVFVLMLFLPLTDSLFHFSGRGALREKRPASVAPSFRFDNFWGFAKGFEAYHADHFGTRGLMVKLFADWRLRVLNLAAVDSVVPGRKGWLFLAQEGPERNVMDYCQGVKPFSSRELETWAAALQARRDWLRRRRCHYLLVMVPDKSAVYPEFLPSRIHPAAETRLDQLRKRLSAEADLLLDLRPALRQAKARGLVYYRGDTHWTDRGAYAGYLAIIGRLQDYLPQLRPLPLSCFREHPETRSGDLAEMLAMAERFQETEPRLEFICPSQARTTELPRPTPWIDLRISEDPRPGLPRGVMFHDSFGNRLAPFLSHHFQRIIFVLDRNLRFDTARIEKEKPDLVIEEMNERFLLGFTPVNPFDRGR